MNQSIRPVATILLLIAGILHAEDAKAEPMTVVVTATKQPQPLSQTADPLDTWSGDELAEQGHRDLRDVWAETPNVAGFSDRPDGRISIRGVGFGERPNYGGEENPTRGQQAPLGVYIDGVAVDAATGLAAFDRLLDIDRVELLRGPQGTLYGRGALAGVVDIHTRDPGAVWEAEGNVYGGSERTVRGSVATGGPLADGLGLRLAAGGGRSDGSLSNRITGSDTTDAWHDHDLRGKAVWSPHAGLTFRLTGSLASHDGSTDYWVPLARIDDRQTQTNHPGSDDQRGNTIGVSSTAQLNATTTLDASVGTSRTSNAVTYDADRSANDLANVDGSNELRTNSAEVRVRQGDGDKPGISWLAGAAAFTQRADYGTSTAFSSTLVPNPFPPYIPPALPYYGWVQQAENFSKSSQSDSTSLALFGESTWRPDRNWGVTVGVRLGHERQRFDWSQQQHSTFPFPAAPDGSYTQEGSRSEAVVLPKLAVSRNLGEVGVAWASLARGYRPGGFNADATSATSAAITYDPEYTWNYELGCRLSDRDEQLSMRNAVFYTDWRNQQVFTNVGPYDVARINASRSQVIGAETTLTARPGAGVELHGGLGLMHSAFVERSDAFTKKDYQGNRFALVPAYNWQAGAVWRHGSGFYVGLDWHGQGAVWLDDANTTEVGAYGLVDARIGYQAKQWSAALVGANLGNRTYALDSFELPADYAFSYNPTTYVRLGPPRMLGVEVSAWW